MRKAIYLLPLAGTILFGWATAHLLRMAWEASNARTWPVANGTVRTSQWRQFTGKGCHYGLNLQYTYVVDGASYRGDNYRFGGECGAEVVRIAAAHPVGSQVPVHYNPEVPARSVVEVGDLSRNTKTGLVVAPVMLLVSLYLFWHLRYRTWPRTS